ncbi:MAG TPA: ATP-binding protein [Anaeromyxobacteraceae bacterium]|nr:ATP-binding protein [Anaeromyxobacteraceae bacterium]
MCADVAGVMTRSVPQPAAESPGNAERDELFRKLGWLTLFRLATVTVLLGGTALATWRAPGEMSEAGGSLFRVVLLTYAASLVFACWLRWQRMLQALAYTQIVFDVAMAAAVVSLTGFADSVFVFLFLLSIVNGSILLFRSGAITSASLSLATYMALVSTTSAPRPHATTVFVHSIAFVMTAALASYLAEQLRRTGERLEEREGDLATITALHESIVQSVASGLVTIDGTGKITFMNRAAEQITGLRLAQIRGMSADRWLSALPSGSGRDETEFVNARGERLRLGYTLFPLVARGEEIGRAVIFQDLTQLRAMEAEVQRSERLADLGSVAAGLAHELRNPLASMAGSIELLKGAPGLGQAEARLMDIVLREAGRLEQLVASFLEFSRPTPPRRERIDLERILTDTLEVFANDPLAARVEVERALMPAVAWCDPDQLRQVFWNLLANAAQACAEQGEGKGRVRVECRSDGGSAQCSVEDNGPGIAPGDLARIFTPFFTTKDRGTGLGLAIVQRIVDVHGGTLSVDTSPGRGSRFTIRLPALPSAREA